MGTKYIIAKTLQLIGAFSLIPVFLIMVLIFMDVLTFFKFNLISMVNRQFAMYSLPLSIWGVIMSFIGFKLEEK